MFIKESWVYLPILQQNNIHVHEQPVTKNKFKFDTS